MGEQKSDPMEVDEVVAGLNAALALQFRAAVGYTLVAGTLKGFAPYGLAAELHAFARAELEDARHLVEKIATLGGEPAPDVAPARLEADPEAAVRWLIEAETECIDALHAVIPHTGQEGRSEALEHRLEHVIMRKQEQVDALLRASGSA
ncbi:MAG TPA: ferritin-like domain-containing protein [Solirubrobacteraceae bacterium]|nr:ferritin-like domain-containing protein [Solirubrobacteraceae bacterium]